jgi:hypothetical protein
MAEDNTNRFLKVQEVIAKNLREMRALRARLEGAEVPVENPPEEDAGLERDRRVMFKAELGCTPKALVAKKRKKQTKKRKPAGGG